MTAPIPDALTALVTFLNDRITPTVYGQELPSNVIPTMPKDVVVLRTAGGPLDRGTITIGDMRIDVRCYGATPYTATQLYNQVFALLKYDLRRIAVGPTLMHSATLESGANHLREPDGNWPFILSSWLVKSAQVAIA